MASLLYMMLRYPFRTIAFSHSFLAQILLILLRRILLPHFPVYQSLRIQLQRAYLSSAAVSFPDLPHRMPVGYLPSSRARQVDAGTLAYLIPGDRRLSDYQASSARSEGVRKCVTLYAHGGGYARGEAKMYVNYMERWVREAAMAKIDLVFLSVEYPLSTQASHPAQLNAFLKAYHYLLDNEIRPSNIVFMGDSAGAGLSILSAIELNNNNGPQPAAAVLISPWLDMAMSAYEGGNAGVESDYFVGANNAVPALISLFIGDRSPSSPEVNPLYRQPAELTGLCPQLVFVGGAEFALDDSKRWVALCKSAGVECSLNVEWGQLHIYAMGSAFVLPAVRRKTDHKILEWISSHLG